MSYHVLDYWHRRLVQAAKTKKGIKNHGNQKKMDGRKQARCGVLRVATISRCGLRRNRAVRYARARNSGAVNLRKMGRSKLKEDKKL